MLHSLKWTFHTNKMITIEWEYAVVVPYSVYRTQRMPIVFINLKKSSDKNHVHMNTLNIQPPHPQLSSYGSRHTSAWLDWRVYPPDTHTHTHTHTHTAVCVVHLTLPTPQEQPPELWNMAEVTSCCGEISQLQESGKRFRIEVKTFTIISQESLLLQSVVELRLGGAIT